MTLIADILLVAGALGASVYCYVLAKRLAKFNDLETGVGGAVAVLSTQVDDLTRTLKSAQNTAGESTKRLEDLTQRAEAATKRMELLLASMHDLPDPAELKAFREAENAAIFVRHMDEVEAAASKPKSKSKSAEKSGGKGQSKRKRREKAQGKKKSGVGMTSFLRSGRTEAKT